MLKGSQQLVSFAAVINRDAQSDWRFCWSNHKIFLYSSKLVQETKVFVSGTEQWQRSSHHVLGSAISRSGTVQLRDILSRHVCLHNSPVCTLGQSNQRAKSSKLFKPSLVYFFSRYSRPLTFCNSAKAQSLCDLSQFIDPSIDETDEWVLSRIHFQRFAHLIRKDPGIPQLVS